MNRLEYKEFLRVHRGAILCWPVSAGVWPKIRPTAAKPTDRNTPNGGLDEFFECVSSVPHPTFPTVD
jgi:hypothetical protein